mgnify:CR=1 FL=1
MKQPSQPTGSRTARDICPGDEFTANVAPRRHQWSRPTPVRATNNANPTDLIEGGVRIEVIVTTTKRRTVVILPASKQL